MNVIELWRGAKGQTRMLNHPTVLIIEDDDDIRTTLQEVLNLDGFENVLTACHGEEGLSLLALHPDCDLVLLDLMMPVMDGWTFLEKKSHITAFEKIPVVVISAAGDRCSRTRATEYLGKPVEIDHLLKTVHKFVRPPQPPNSNAALATA